MALLHFLKGANQGTTMELKGDRFVLGRNQDCDVVLNVPAVSREPGFVAGYRTNDGEHSYNMIIFDSREAAEARAAGVRGNAAGQAVAGHHCHSDHHRRGAGERPGGHRVNAGKSNPDRRVAVDRIADARPPRGGRSDS